MTGNKPPRRFCAEDALWLLCGLLALACLVAVAVMAGGAL